MKSTQERLNKSYCRPTKNEWRALGIECPFRNSAVVKRFNDSSMDVTWTDYPELPNLRQEIPVSHFIDLLSDSIVPWRLEEDGFTETDFETCLGYEFALPNGVTIQITQGLDVAVIEGDGLRRNLILFQGCKTYTDLLTLIRLIG
jgi:hypothetical protein